MDEDGFASVEKVAALAVPTIYLLGVGPTIPDDFFLLFFFQRVVTARTPQCQPTPKDSFSIPISLDSTAKHPPGEVKIQETPAGLQRLAPALFRHDWNDPPSSGRLERRG